MAGLECRTDADEFHTAKPASGIRPRRRRHDPANEREPAALVEVASPACSPVYGLRPPTGRIVARDQVASFHDGAANGLLHGQVCHECRRPHRVDAIRWARPGADILWGPRLTWTRPAPSVTWSTCPVGWRSTPCGTGARCMLQTVTNKDCAGAAITPIHTLRVNCSAGPRSPSWPGG